MPVKINELFRHLPQYEHGTRLLDLESKFFQLDIVHPAVYKGIFKGFDHATNIILDESHERVYSTKEGVQQIVMGLYIIRGDNISIVGELDDSRVGTACVAMVAHQFRIPVLICCEAYKFHERVQLDSICSNELGDPDAISTVVGRQEISSLDGWAKSENLQMLNMMFEVDQLCWYP